MFLIGVWSIHLNAQQVKTTLYFKDGTVKSGYGKLANGDKVKFKKEKKEKAVKYHFSLLKEVQFDLGNILTYVYLNVKNIEKPKVLKRIVDGKISLYTLATGGYAPASNAGGGFGGVYMYYINDFYVKKATSKSVTHLGSDQLFSKNFKKAASVFFKDCPSLVEKIQNEELKKRDIKEIVEYYNENCN